MYDAQHSNRKICQCHLGAIAKFNAHQSVLLYDVPVHAITGSGVLCPGVNSLTVSSSWVFRPRLAVLLYSWVDHAITCSGVLCPGVNSLTVSSSWVFRPRLAVLLYSWVDQAFPLSLNDMPNLGLIKEVFRAFVRPTSALGLPG